MSREELRDGYVSADGELYEPDAYFERLAGGLGDGTTPFAPARARYWRRHPLKKLRGQALNLLRAAGLYGRLRRHVKEPELWARYRREIRTQLLRHRDPGRVLGYVIRCALHFHHYTLARQMGRRHGAVVRIHSEGGRADGKAATCRFRVLGSKF